MQRKVLVGPTLEDVRPVKHDVDLEGRSSGFPLYEGLVERLLGARAADAQPHAVARHASAVLAAWAYAGPESVAHMMARLGLFESRVAQFEVRNAAMLIDSAATLVQSPCGRVALLAYRGSHPFQLTTWATTGDLRPPLVPVAGSAEARVHGGFYRNQRATWPAVVGALRDMLEGKALAGDAGSADVGKLEALFITGHGIGGAMAQLAAYKLATDPHPTYRALADRLTHVYTFGQPMVGNAAFSRVWTEIDLLRTRVFCHTHGFDVVPHLPPRGATSFRHVGKHFTDLRGSQAWADEARDEPKQASSPLDMVRAVLPLPNQVGLRHGFERLGRVGVKSVHALLNLFFKDATPYSFFDHLPTHYVVCSQPAGKLTEFGDDF